MEAFSRLEMLCISGLPGAVGTGGLVVIRKGALFKA